MEFIDLKNNLDHLACHPQPNQLRRSFVTNRHVTKASPICCDLNRIRWCVQTVNFEEYRHKLIAEQCNNVDRMEFERNE